MAHEEKPPYKPTEMEIDNAVNCLKDLMLNYTKPASVTAEEILETLTESGSIEEAICTAKTMANRQRAILVNLYAVTNLEGRK